ncbi:hypothetical protein [Neobacillus bataviensis]|uniref:hypothetical protein n=1 Tax=Neobacillus bataviensis TaxID=220685 RepID=UPI001CBFEBDC|nr:hypothetical protein [Neobacillus bataviensis]
MKKFLLAYLLIPLLLIGCSSEKPSLGFTYDEYKARINDALKQMGNKTTLKIINEDVTDDGKKVIALSNNIMIFLVLNEDKIVTQANLAANDTAYLTEMDNFKFAFLLLIGTVDDSLSFGERNKVL